MSLEAEVPLCPYLDSDNEAVLEAPAPEGDVVVAAQGGELMGEGQGALQPTCSLTAGHQQYLGRRWRERGAPIVPWRAGTEEDVGRDHGPGWPRQATAEEREQGTRRNRRGGGQSDSKWRMLGFSVDPGGAVLVAGRYTVKAVQSQMTLQGDAGREIWLGVDLCRGRGVKITGWIQSSEMQAMLTS